MENLSINIHPDLVFYPIIKFNAQSGECEISGESYMEDTYKFYEPVINWLNDYTKENKQIILNLKLTYFNTSSSKYVMEMLDILKNHNANGNKITVNWFYHADDPDMLKEIDEFVEETGIKINTITF